jgi:hypothetical protein
MPASGDFKLSISKALTDQLRAHLALLTPAPLSAANLAPLERRPGVYQLYLGKDLVYVGSAAGNLPGRLRKHLRKISGRRRIAISEVSFTCLYVDEDLTVLAPEDSLIKASRLAGTAPWNANGFGNNDPGRRRDETRREPTHFDRLYPINLKHPCGGVEAGPRTAAKLLAELKRKLPFLLRYERKSADKIYAKRKVAVPRDDMRAEDLLRLLATALPDFQVTALPGYVIIYRERRAYPNSRIFKP